MGCTIALSRILGSEIDTQHVVVREGHVRREQRRRVFYVRDNAVLTRYGFEPSPSHIFAIVIAAAPPVERVGRSKRVKLATPRTSIDELTRERIRQLAADGWSLRHIATELGMSHESERHVLVVATLSVKA